MDGAGLIHPGCGDKNIDTPEGIDSGLDDPGYIRLIGGVTGEHALAPVSFAHFFQFRERAARDHHFGARRSQGRGCRFAEAARGAGDEGNFTRDIE